MEGDTFKERDEEFRDFSSYFGQRVFYMRWHGGLLFTQYEAVGNQGLQALGQHLLTDTVQGAPELIPAKRTAPQGEQDQRAPLVRHMTQNSAGGAVSRD